MKLAILLAAAVLAQQACCDEPEQIVASTATIGQFKYQVYLRSSSKLQICGGNIISSTHILTAAHCVDDEHYTDDMVVVSGTINLAAEGDRHDIKSIRIHPNYTDERYGGCEDDIAVITLKKPIKINCVQGPIPLTSKNHVNGDERGIVSGWGKSISGLISPILKWLSVNVLSQERCLSDHKNPRTNENQICTERGEGACLGDSGGPLVIDGELVGVASRISSCTLGISDVYTNVYKYLDFIKESQSLC